MSKESGIYAVLKETIDVGPFRFTVREKLGKRVDIPEVEGGTICDLPSLQSVDDRGHNFTVGRLAIVRGDGIELIHKIRVTPDYSVTEPMGTVRGLAINSDPELNPHFCYIP